MKQCGECNREAEFFYLDANGGEVNRCARHDAHDKGEPCEDTDCQECCSHRDLDHGICLDCSLDLSADIAARAYDRAKDLRKYGEDA